MKLNDDKNKLSCAKYLNTKCFLYDVLPPGRKTCPLTCGRGRKQSSPGGPPALVVAVTVAAVGVGGVAIVVVSVHGRLVRVMSVFRTQGQNCNCEHGVYRSQGGVFGFPPEM